MAKVMSVMSGARRATFITLLESAVRLAGTIPLKYRRISGAIRGAGLIHGEGEQGGGFDAKQRRMNWMALEVDGFERWRMWDAIRIMLLCNTMLPMDAEPDGLPRGEGMSPYVYDFSVQPAASH